jgi:hypothetical protein
VEKLTSFFILEEEFIMKKQNTGKRFGTIAVEKGFITVDQLVKALNIQAREDVEGKNHRLIGSILIDQGFMTDSQVNEILETMSQQMIYKISVAR